MNFLTFKPDTENSANFDVVSRKTRQFDEVYIFKTST